jgi:hypothetical protein
MEAPHSAIFFGLRYGWRQGASWSLKQTERRVFALLALTEPRPDSV